MVATAKALLVVVVAGVLIGFLSPVQAQITRELTSRYGGYLDAGLNFHSANFQMLPGVPSCCPRYETGSGFGPAIGVYYDWTTESPLSYEFRFGYSSLNAILTKDEATT